MVKSLDQIMADLHSKLGEELLKRIESGEATSSELNVARQFLKDNGIDDIPRDNSPLSALSDLSVFDEDDPESMRH